MVAKLATHKNFIFLLVSVTEQAGFEHHLVTNPENIFYRDKAHIIDGAVNGIFQQDQSFLRASI